MRLAQYCRFKPPTSTVFFFEEDFAELELHLHRGDVLGLFRNPHILVELAGRFRQRGVLL